MDENNWSLLINREKTRGDILEMLISNFLIYETNFRPVQLIN